MSYTTLRFPQAVKMVEYLLKHKDLNADHYKEKGIAKAVANLATERLAEKKIEFHEVNAEAKRLTFDLSIGKDPSTGQQFSKVVLPEILLKQLLHDVENALIDCAKQSL